MSIITCQIGQCGNQLGEAIFNRLMGECLVASPSHQMATLDTFFSYSDKAESRLIANALMIDMEPKVVDGILARGAQRGWEYDPKQVVVKQEGSGNNWAYGFNFHGVQTADDILGKLRKSFEKADLVDGMLILQSLAGGTGSGVGSRILTRVREEFPEINIYSVAVLPRFSGEVILQFYNSVFSLSTLYNVRYMGSYYQRNVMEYSCLKTTRSVTFASKYTRFSSLISQI